MRLDRLSGFSALLSAARLAFRGTRGPQAVRFMLDREAEVLRLQHELRDGCYAPGPYHTFEIRDPKPRTISAAAFRDRVVHHALCAEIAPDLDRGACPDSYACRVGKGTLAALWRAAGLVRRHRFVLCLDIEHFFETLNHDVLLRLLSTRLGDDALVRLAEKFVRAGAPGSDPGLGVPIGNLTSQYFANFYLGPLDRLVTRGLRAAGYVRYMDDMLVFGETREALWDAYAAIEAFVTTRLALRLKPRHTRLQPVSEGVRFLGWRLFPGTVRLDGARRHRLIRRWRFTEKRLARLTLSEEDAHASVGSVVAWARWGHTHALRCALQQRGIAGPR